MKVVVYNDNLEKAMKVLKKKLQRNGIMRECKARQCYEKPFEKRKRLKIEAMKRIKRAMYKNQMIDE